MNGGWWIKVGGWKLIDGCWFDGWMGVGLMDGSVLV